MKIYVLESVDEVDGGFLPDARRVLGIFSSYELAEEYFKKEGYVETEIDINEEDLDKEDLDKEELKNE